MKEVVILDDAKLNVEAGVIVVGETSLHYEPFYMMAGCDVDGWQ